MSLTTRLDAYRLAYDESKLDAFEHRLSNYGAFNVFKKDTPNLVPGFADIELNRMSAARTVSVPVIAKQSYTVTGTRSCTASTYESTSAFVDTSWNTLRSAFEMIPAQYKGDYLKYEQDFNRKMFNLQKAFLTSLDNASLSALSSNKAAYDGTSSNPYPFTGSVYQVPLTDSTNVFNEAKAILLADDLPMDGLNVIGSPRTLSLVNKYSAQGAGNAQNLLYQLTGYNFNYTPRLSVATSDIASMYICPEGSLAFLSWVDIDAQQNFKAGIHEWTTMELPLLGITVGVHYQATCADNSGTLTGLNASATESYEFSFDYALMNAYNSDTSNVATPILAFHISNS